MRAFCRDLPRGYTARSNSWNGLDARAFADLVIVTGDNPVCLALHARCGSMQNRCRVVARTDRVRGARPRQIVFIPAMRTPLLRVLPRTFYRRDPRQVAPELLNKILLGADGRSARIVETEAYCGPIDEAAHSFRGKTARNATMFGPPGHLYVYFTYGMHWCANAVCGEEDDGVGVLLRAAQPLTGLDCMRALRGLARSDRELCSGPARLCQAFGITRADDGCDLVSGRYRIASDGTPPPTTPVVGPRVGVSRASALPWRWYVPDNRHVSRR